MIYDQLSALSTYYGLHPHLDKALKAVETASLSALDLGRYEIDGDKAFYLIQENTLDTDATPECEIHESYLDVHFLLEGKEVVRYGFGDREVAKPFDVASDFGTVVCERSLDLAIDATQFALFFPGEAHRPNLSADQETTVRKCVIKVKID